MKIENIEVLDIDGKGTLIIRTHVDGEPKDPEYAWYILMDNEVLFKSCYQDKPYFSYPLKMIGNYTIKAFVRNSEGEKISETVLFKADAQTSPQLAKRPNFRVRTQNLGQGIWKFYINEPISKKAMYAWYVYENGNPEPIFKQMFTKRSELMYAFEKDGKYFVKTFIRVSDVKQAVRSDVFRVEGSAQS